MGAVLALPTHRATWVALAVLTARADLVSRALGYHRDALAARADLAALAAPADLAARAVLDAARVACAVLVVLGVHSGAPAFHGNRVAARAHPDH